VHTTRRFFLALLTIVVGIAVPMTLEPSGVVLAVMWSLIGMALLGTLLTWEPVARRLPYRVVRTVAAHELPPETAEADARLASDCERLANDIDSWLTGQSYDEDGRFSERMPPEFSVKFDGRIFRCVEAGQSQVHHARRHAPDRHRQLLHRARDVRCSPDARVVASATPPVIDETNERGGGSPCGLPSPRSVTPRFARADTSVCAPPLARRPPEPR
jgi:hypothetical protein